MTLALPLFGELAAWVVMWGILTLLVMLIGLAFWLLNETVGRFPGVGSFVRSASHRVEQYVSNKITDAIVKMEHRIWHSWYQLAHLTEWVGREIAAHANVLTVLANLIANPGSIAAWRAAINGAHTAIQGVRSSIGGAISTNLRPITSRVARLERRTHLWYLALHFAIAVTIPGELLNLRHRNRSLTDSITNAWKLLKKHERLLGIGAMTGVVAVVLSRLGLGWTRCNNVGRVGKNICGMNPSLLESLLADSLLIAGSLSLVEMGKELQPIVGDSARLIQNFWRVG